MIRYLRLYGSFVRFSFSRALEFRLDFFFRIGMDALWYAMNLTFFWVLYRHTALLGGWTLDQTLVFAGGVFVADAIQMSVLSNNMWWLPIFINRGDLDYYLVRPVSPLWFLSLRDFAANSFLNLLMAIGIFAWAVARVPGPVTAAALALYVALLLLGVFLHYTLQVMFLIPTFWMHASGGLREIFWSLDQLTSRPHGIYGGWVRRIVVSILPFSLIVSFPTQGFFAGFSAGLVLHLVGVTAVSALVMLLLWRAGLRSYGSASS
jgi:ABC-2 type transport system permease protein